MKNKPGKIERIGKAAVMKNVSMLWNCSESKQVNSCMNIHPGFKEWFQLLEEHHVEYMIVGGYAVAFHGYYAGFSAGSVREGCRSEGPPSVKKKSVPMENPRMPPMRQQNGKWAAV